MGSLGFPEMVVIAIIVLLVFGARRLPEIGASIGKGIREFKKSISEIESPTNPSIGGATDTPGLPGGRQFDAPDAPNTASSGEPKRLSQ